MARKKERVPGVLWRLYRNRARTLAQTILALCSEEACGCRKRRCITCNGRTALVKPEDGVAFRNLVDRCYVVVSEAAPAIGHFKQKNHRWCQDEVVKRINDMMLANRIPRSSNLIIYGYDRKLRSSDTVETLSSPEWKLLLNRVGDAVMVYILRNTSIFLPLPRNKYRQIVGYPINNLHDEFPRPVPVPEPNPQHHVLASSGSKRKAEEAESVSRKKQQHAGSSTECQRSLHETTNQSQKSTRQPRWRRQRERRWLVGEENPSLIPCRGNDGDNLLPRASDQINVSRGCCCLVFQEERKINVEAEIDRRFIFYRVESSISMLPRNHLLHSLRATDAGASTLFNDIFKAFSISFNGETIPMCVSENGCPSDPGCLYHTLTKLLKRIISNSRHRGHVRLLHKHCPSSRQDASTSTGAGNELEGTESRTIRCCPKKDVVSFIWAVCRKIVPPSLLGECYNWRILRSNISKFIHLRRHEKFSLKECVFKLKLSKFPLFSVEHNGCREPAVADSARHAMLECWIFWFFEHLVSPLVQASFYVTESEHEKQEVQYYPTAKWEKMVGEAECMMGDRYRLLNQPSLQEILGRREFGFSKARLRPKQNGYRMLANLRAPSRLEVTQPYFQLPYNQNLPGPVRFLKAVNTVLHDPHVILKGLRAKAPEQLGSSVFNYNDVYKKLVPFLSYVRNRSTGVPIAFMVVADVSNAFDSVDQEKLLSVMKDVIVDENFTLEKLTYVSCSGESVKVNYHHTLAPQDIATASASIKSWSDSLGIIVVKKEVARSLRKEDVNSILEEHITRNVVRLGNNFYQQCVGIPQGSILSSSLCSFYYEHMEKNVIFPFLEKAIEDQPVCDYLLLRFIDDFLFLSTSEEQASKFFSRLDRGFRDYNCCMNQEKYGLNFSMNNGHERNPNRTYVGNDGISYLRWSGLLVNCNTLEIQADYTRYLNVHLSSTLTVVSQGDVGKHLKKKLRNYLMPKCHSIFFDSNVNSPGVVRLNIYQAFLFCAMKFISYISNMSVVPTFTPDFCFNAIQKSLSYMAKLIKRKMYCSSTDLPFRPKYDVKKREVRWLGLYAFERVLKKKQSRYVDLLNLLKAKLKEYGEVENMSDKLKYAVDDAHSSVMWSIKY